MDEAGLPTAPASIATSTRRQSGAAGATATLAASSGAPNPVGWMADLAYVRSSENRSQGATLGRRLAGLCDGVRFRYIFR